MEKLLIPACIAAAYLVGAVPFGLLACKLFRGIDIREHGSGNIGATNVYRVAGPTIGIPVFMLDVAKGAVPVLMARTLVLRCEAPPLLEVGCALGAILGHMYSIYLRGGGGKGVATAAGALGALAFRPVAAGVVAWVVVLVVVRMVSVASILAAAMAAGASWFTSPDPGGAQFWQNLFFLLVALLVTWKHRANLARVWRGEEPRILQKQAPPEVECG